ncbi:MAG: hypothetical protein HZA81_03265 [Candidatus Taylorbacteria bacterium]|nr:hypothetical protein [Candidatus Taylorbacteria bacterium]
MFKRTTDRTKGSSLVEVVVAAAILGSVSLAFFGSFAALSRFHQKSMLSIKGSLLAEEGLEALRLMKDDGWTNLSAIPTATDRYLALGTSTWSASTTPEVVDGVFYRSFRLYPVSRDASDDIVTAGGTVDPDTLLAESAVSWSWRGSTTTVTYMTYVTNI